MSRFFALLGILVSAFVAFNCASTGGSGGPGKTSCGNGKIDEGEDCDGQNVDGQSCTGLGYKAGTLTCNPLSCKFELTSCCADECANPGDTICQSNMLATCKDVGGCRVWDETEDCASQGRICTASGSEARCKSPGCVDQCPAANKTQCNEHVLETCAIGTDGCTKWTQTKDCTDDGGACDASSGTAQCVTECSDQCTLDATQCSGNVVQKCIEIAGCTAWQNDTDCSQNGEACTTDGSVATCGPACATNECPSEGVQTCLSAAVNTCTKQPDGCLKWAVTADCTQLGLLCKFGAGGTAQCQGACNNPCPTAGVKQCNANIIQECKLSPGNCNEWQVVTTCPLGQTCSDSGGSHQCVTAAATGEDCGTVMPVTGGINTIDWTATKNNYLLSPPSCGSSYAIEGPDIVLAYTAPITGSVDFTITKPANQRVSAVVGTGTCGSLASQLACASDYAPTSIGGSFAVTQGNTYFFYIGDTTQPVGANLPDPLTISIAEIVCSTFNASGIAFSPAKGATTTSLSPKLSVDFDTAVTTSTGTITLTGNKGTNLSFNLPSSAVTFTNSNKTMNINPGIAFPAGEVVTVNWAGLVDAKCSKPVTSPGWSFTIVTPPCSPGQNGMLGASVTKVNTPLTTTYYHMAVDTSPTGYVYFGNTSSLERVSKDGTILQSVDTLAGLSTTHLGYEMVIAGNDMFTFDTKSTGTNGFVWRITSTGGASWTPQDFVTFPASPTDGFYSAAAYKGQLFLVTREISTNSTTQFWSAPIGAPPNAAKLEHTISGEQYCNALAVDDQYYYAACYTNDRLIRVDRTTGAVTLLSNQFDLNSSIRSAVVADDVNGDGTADYLYYKGGRSEVYVVCSPASATPYVDMLVSYGTSTSSYGLALDPVNNTLYAWDYTPKQIVVIK